VVPAFSLSHNSGKNRRCIWISSLLAPPSSLGLVLPTPRFAFARLSSPFEVVPGDLSQWTDRWTPT